MAVFRIKKTGDYTVMSNHHFKNRNLSLRAKGLLSMMLSLPDDWNYTIEGLVSMNKDGRDAIRSALKELEEEGYLVATRERDSNGRLNGTIYNIYESPHTEKPISEKPTLVKPMLEKPLQSNTNISNTKDISNTHSIYIGKGAEKPSVDDIQAYIDEKNLNVDADFFFTYFEEGGWKDSTGKPVKNWKQKLLTWDRKNGSKKKEKEWHDPKCSFPVDDRYPL